MLKVCVAKNLGGGFVPSIENEDEDSIWLAYGYECPTAQEACAEAARRLREAAARFDLLAQEKMITYETTQDRINAAPVTV